MNFKDIFDALTTTYGIWGLVIFLGIVGLFIMTPYLFNKNNKSVTKTLEKISTDLTLSIQNQNAQLISTLKDNEKTLIESQVQIVQEVLNQNKKIHDEHLNERDNVSIPIQNKINHLKDYYQTSRVSVIEFHNSLVNLNGLPFLWYDLIYESIAKGIHSMSLETKNMPFNILTPITSAIVHGDIKIFHRQDIEDFYNQSSVLYDFSINRMHINDLIVAPLLNKDNNLAAILVLEYSEDNHLHTDGLNLDELELEAHTISTLLQLRKDRKNN